MSFRYTLPITPRETLRAAFTLVEVLVSMTVLLILLLISAQVIGTVQSTWTTSNARISQFREARTAFDIITRNLSQATLNTYVDYDNSYLNPSSTTTAGATTLTPQNYVRKSNLRFVCDQAAALVPQAGGLVNTPGHALFFQAPLGIAHNAAYVGLDRLLCGRGYFVQYTSDDFFRPEILPAGLPRYRYRLMEFSPPAEKNLIYSGQDAAGTQNNEWFAGAGVPLEQEENGPANPGLTRPIADNIIALIISPQTETDPNGVLEPTAIAPNFAYDSLTVGAAGAVGGGGGNLAGQGTQHLLPPLVKVVLIAIDEKSADRLTQGDTSGTPPFGATISDLIDEDTEAANLNVTLEQIAQELRNRRVNYRIFSATVVLRGAKWSI